MPAMALLRLGQVGSRTRIRQPELGRALPLTAAAAACRPQIAQTLKMTHRATAALVDVSVGNTLRVAGRAGPRD